MDKCSLAVVQDEAFKYVHFAALPPLFFDLKADPHQFVNRAGDPATLILDASNAAYARARVEDATDLDAAVDEWDATLATGSTSRGGSWQPAARSGSCTSIPRAATNSAARDPHLSSRPT